MNSIATDIFSYAGISKTLAAIHGKNHGKNAIFPLRDWAGQPGVILRHDIDLDVEMAVRLAETEASIGIRSTILFLTTCDSYNVSSATNRAHLRALDKDGFEVGLHFDPTIYGDPSIEVLAEKAADERKLLEDIIGAAVKSVSLHNPSIHGRYVLFPGWINAYDPAIFDEDCYLSDSRMKFRHEPVAFFAERVHKTCQLLLHPMHYSVDGGPYPNPILSHIERQAGDLDAMFRVNSTYQEVVSETGFWSAMAANASRRADP
ncbi:MAG: hypothetical protein ACRCWO_11980 [Bosea sp. (in: a-proteobacteria)]